MLSCVTTSQAHDSFRVNLDGRSCIIFSSETNNHWYLILSVGTGILYADSHRQIAALDSVNLLMLLVFTVFYTEYAEAYHRADITVLRDFLEQINVIVGGQCEDKGLQHECRVIGTPDERFIGDDLKLKQVLISILGNSVKFTERPGSVFFSVEELERSDGRCRMRFVITDTGIGMDKALIVEDQEMNAEVLADLLEMEEMTSEWAENGQIAVEMFSRSEADHFDAILMDMRMPVMDGVTATHEIRKLDRPDAQTIPIIALTANAFEEDVQQCLQAGMNAHLSKPVDINVLASTLGRLIAGETE